jgi:hypothetical protein
MFYYSNTFDISQGNISDTFIGSFSPAPSNVVSGQLTIQTSASATVALTIKINSVPYTPPIFDLSAASGTVIPFIVPIVSGDASINYSTTITGASGTYTIEMAV